jgi:hypothetical protein
MVVGTMLAYQTGLKPVYPLSIDGVTYPVYIGVLAGGLNLVVSVVISFLLGLAGVRHGADETEPLDYILSVEPAAEIGMQGQAMAAND